MNIREVLSLTSSGNVADRGFLARYNPEGFIKIRILADESRHWEVFDINEGERLYHYLKSWNLIKDDE